MSFCGGVDVIELEKNNDQFKTNCEILRQTLDLVDTHKERELVNEDAKNKPVKVHVKMRNGDELITSCDLSLDTSIQQFKEWLSEKYPVLEVKRMRVNGHSSTLETYIKNGVVEVVQRSLN